ncbi:MAG: hypothetical protein ACRBDL_02430 [Alphaproteobacteria bacterium]
MPRSIFLYAAFIVSICVIAFYSGKVVASPIQEAAQEVCLSYPKATSEYCDCVSGSPLDDYLSMMTDKYERPFLEHKLRVERTRDMILTDPEMNDTRIEMYCTVHDRYDTEIKALPLSESVKIVERQNAMRLELHALHNDFNSNRISRNGLQGLCVMQSNLVRKKSELDKVEAQIKDGSFSIDIHRLRKHARKACAF